jgi:hypothetical protein
MIVGVIEKHRTSQHWNKAWRSWRSYGDGESARRVAAGDGESVRKTAAQREAAIFLPTVSAQEKGRQEEATNIGSVYFFP